MAVTGHVQQPVTLHPRYGLADRGPTLVKPFGDPGTQRGNALFLEVVNGPQVHLGGINQVVHSAPSIAAESTCPPAPMFRKHPSAEGVPAAGATGTPSDAGWVVSWRMSAAGRRA